VVSCALAAAKPPQAADQAGGLGAARAGERVRLVEDEEIEPGVGKQLHVDLPRQQQLQLLDVGQEDAGLTAGGPHPLPRAGFFRRVDGVGAAGVAIVFEHGLVVRAAGAGGHAAAGHFVLLLRRLAHVHAEGDAAAGQQAAEPVELVLGQGVHRIDDHGDDARLGRGVGQVEALADDGVEEALGLARAGAGADQRRPPRVDRADRPLLVAVDVDDPRRDDMAHVRVEDALVDQLLDRGPFAKPARQADVGPVQERRAADLVDREQLPHLGVQPRVGERIGRKLVLQEAADDFLGVDDRVDGHEGYRSVELIFCSIRAKCSRIASKVGGSRKNIGCISS
jgi:hypothetical protein